MPGALLLLSSAHAAVHTVYINNQTSVTPADASLFFANPGDLAALAAEDNVWSGDCTTLAGGCGPLRQSHLQFPPPAYACAGTSLASVTLEYLYRVQFKAANSNELFTVEAPAGNTQTIRLWPAGSGVEPATAGTYTLSPVPTRAELAAADWQISNDGEIQFDYMRLRIDDGCPAPVTPAAAAQPVPTTGWAGLVLGFMALAWSGARRMRGHKS
jgi:hypothetical protein